jgi:hypothetical protein
MGSTREGEIDMQRMKKTWLTTALAALVVLQLQGCASSDSPSTQPPATQTGQTHTPQGQAPANQQAASLDLTRELTLHPTIVIGKTTLAEMIKAYGKPVKLVNVKSNFRTEILEKKENAPQIEQIMGQFKVNPLTGKPFDKPFPFYFTKGDNPVLVAAPIFLMRGDLLEKERKGKVTLEDVKKVYGEPAREIEGALEYYDFDHHISLIVFTNKSGNVGTMLTKYDLLYGSNTQDMQTHEEIIKVSKQAPQQ